MRLPVHLDERQETGMTPTITYDPESDAAYIRFSPEPVEESEEVSDGIVLDYDATGRIAAWRSRMRGRICPQGCCPGRGRSVTPRAARS